MRILQIIPELNIGGVETGVVDLCKFFREQGVYSVVVSAGGVLVPELLRQNTVHYQLPVHKKSLFSMIRCVKSLRKIIKKERIDIVHARSRIPFWIGFFATRNTAAQLVATMHGCYSPRVSSRVICWIKQLICPSAFAAHYFNRHFAVPFEKVQIIPRWVDAQRFSYRPYDQRSKIDFILCYIGRLAPAKGVEYLLRSLIKVKRVIPRIHLKIVGTSSKRAYIRSLQEDTERYGLSHTVEFLGGVRDIEKILHQSHIAVMPSIGYESFGRVIIEAQSCGIVVIATNTGAQEEIIQDGRTGYLVLPKDSDAIADKIIKVLSDRQAAVRMTERARAVVEEKYTLSKIGPMVLEVYKRALQVQHILVIKLSSLGDVVLSIPALKALRKRHPRARISVLVQRKYMKILEAVPDIDECIPYESPSKGIGYALKVAAQLRRKSFDYVIDLQNNTLSHFVGFLCLSRIFIGYDRKWGFLLHVRIPYKGKEKIDPLASQQKVLAKLEAEVTADDLVLQVPSHWQEQQASFLEENGIKNTDSVIGFHVSASAEWHTKNWPVIHTQKLISMLLKDKGAKVVLTGDENAAALAQEIVAGVDNDALINLCGKTSLVQFVGAVRRCEVFICPDTAALHIATALNIPTIAFFGPTDPARHAVSRSCVHVINRKMKCSYCYSKVCAHQPKEEQRQSLCLKKVTPQEVFSLVKELKNT